MDAILPHLHAIADADLAALRTLAHPDSPVSVDDLTRQAAIRRPGEHHTQQAVFERGEARGAVTTGVPRMDAHDGWLDLTLTLHPQEAGGPLADALLAAGLGVLRAAGATTAVTRVREDWWEHDFLRARGWQEADRMWLSTLDLRSLDFGAFAADEARARASGVRIVPLSDLGGWDAHQREHYDLIHALLTDVPSARPVQVWPFEVWLERMPTLLPDTSGVMIAVAPDGTWVGTSQLSQPIATRPGFVHNGLTGVRSGWRGHGLGLALKLAAARAALARGFTHSRTGNHVINRPMLAINERMGFEREAATVTLTREVERRE